MRAEMKKQSTRQVLAEAERRPPEAPTPTAADKKRSNLTAFALEDHVKKTFPMMVMPIATFLELETMRPYEELLAEGKIFEWDEAKGPVFFLPCLSPRSSPSRCSTCRRARSSVTVSRSRCVS